MNIGSLRDAGANGYYWGVSAYPSRSYAYYLNFNSVNVYPSDSDAGRWYGFTVCKAIKTIIIGRRIDIIITKISIIITLNNLLCF